MHTTISEPVNLPLLLMMAPGPSSSSSCSWCGFLSCCSLIGKVAADHSHKWVFKEPQEHETSSLISSWSNPADSVRSSSISVYLLHKLNCTVVYLKPLISCVSHAHMACVLSQHPRTWEAQFQCGIQVHTFRP